MLRPTITTYTSKSYLSNIDIIIKRCYTFLKSTGNVDLLLKCSLREAQSQDEMDTKAVLDSLDEFIRQKNK